MALTVRELETYHDALPYWRELEQVYRSGELTFDLEAHRIIWEGFYRARGAALKIVAVLDGGRCIGLFPLLHTNEDARGSWTFTDDFLIAREYFCPPARIHEVLPLLPPHLADDLSCFYVPRVADGFVRVPGAVIDLRESREAYLGSLAKKPRQQLRRTWEANADLRVEEDSRVRREVIGPLVERYLDYWKSKSGGDAGRVAYSRDKVATDLTLMERAAALGKLVALYFSLNGELVAANFAALRERDRVDDYLCLRNAADELAARGIGIYAVLRNMESCRARGVRYYDLSAWVTEYKRKFLNAERFFYAWGAGPPYQATRPAALAEGRPAAPSAASGGAARNAPGTEEPWTAPPSER